MQRITLGTAGHIDHGKSALIQALTGQNPDRLKEEKERGITVDLGFAHWQAGPERQIGFVDVPGHEGLVHNMLAGAQGFSGVLLCIAADEGPMPQTLEHFNLCRLLGLRQGAVILTKADLADAELIDLLKLELAELFEGSFLEAAPVITTSVKTGQGLDQLKELLRGPHFSPPEPQGPFRLPIDRSFTLKGFGTIVSGTVLSGQARLDSPLHLFPEDHPVKLRGMQSGGKDTEQIQAGMRAALNLGGLTTEQVGRGQQLAQPGSLVVTQRLGVKLMPLPSEAHRIKARKPIKLFAGSAQVMGQLIPLETFEPEAGPLYCLIKLDSPLALRFGDRLILRGSTPERSLGGALALALKGPLNRRSKQLLSGLLPQLEEGTPEAKIEALVRLSGPAGLLRGELSTSLGLGTKAADKALSALLAQQAVLEPDKSEGALMAPEAATRLGRFFQKALERYHQARPEELGAPAQYFYGKVSRLLPPGRVAGLLGWAVRQNLLAKTDNFYHLRDFKGGLSKAQKALTQAAIQKLAQTAPAVPGLFHLAEALEVEKGELFKTLKRAEKAGEVVQVSEDLFYRPDDLADLKDLLREHMGDGQTFTVIQFKELSGLTRKNAIALLEFFDQERFTFRSGDERVLGA